MAGEKTQSLPIEERFIEHEIEGKVVLVPALNRTWVKLAEKNFCRYISHPDPGQPDYVEERALWLEVTHFVVEDLEWLLRQEHHIFWSHMIFCMEAQWLVLTFLQEAPPYYVRHEFPKDDEMEYLLSKAEHMAFLVLRRLATKRESPEHHIRNLGDLLYNSYLFTIPMFFDIYNVYGFKNRALVAKLFHDVVCISPRFLQDLEIVPPFFMKVLQMVKDQFDVSSSAVSSKMSKMKPEALKNLFLHLLDTCANMHMFFDINTNFAKCMRTEAFLSEIAFFYTYIIPKISDFIKKPANNLFDNFKERVDFMRLNLLSIVRTIFCCTINDIVNDEQNREEYANEYLTRLMDILQEQLFISDYNKVYPIENDLRMLCDLCPNLDTINLKYIIDAVASCGNTKYKPDDLKEFRLGTLISEVKDILPYLGDGFIEFCLRYYDFDTEKVVTAIVEDSLPPSLDELDRNMKRPNEDDQKLIRARISAEKQFRIDKQRTTLEGVLDIGKPGANKYGINIGKKRSGSEQKTDKADANAEDEKTDKEGPSAECEEKTDKAGASSGNEEKAGPSGGNEQKAGPSGGYGQKAIIKRQEARFSDPDGRREKALLAFEQDMVSIFNSRVEIQQIKHKILSFVEEIQDYEDEYDDTYDDKNMLLKEGRNVEEDRKAGANRMTFRPGGSDYEYRSSDEEGAKLDNATAIRARLLQRRMNKLRRDFIARKRAQVQEREELLSRRFKETHKSAIGNHDRKYAASKKRNDLGNN